MTWNIHGRKQIVWRCVNRIEYGTKFCSSHRPSRKKNCTVPF
ncbi:hypothetical protein [Gemmiger formicilis]